MGLYNPAWEVVMAKKRDPSDVVNLKLRFTEALRARIEQEAKKNQRSLNREIVYRLGTTLGAEGAELAAQYEHRESELTKQLQEIVQAIIADRKRKDR
jgi:NAD dependent epimerase/dehydratase family enzyme